MTPVTQEQVDNLLAVSSLQEAILFGRVLVQSYMLPCGFIITATANVTDAEDFDISIGRGVANNKAAQALREILTYEAFVQHSLKQME